MEDLLNAMFEYKSTDLYTALPAIVVGVNDNLSGLSVNVQPAINIKHIDGDVTPRPTILNVPVQMPASSTSAFTFPVNVGDSVLLIFSMNGIDTWKRGVGKSSTPSDFRHHSIRDCVAITGVFPFANSVNNPSKRSWPHSTQDTVMVHNIGKGTETEIRMKPSGDIVINTNQNITANCNTATVNASKVEVNASSMNVDVGSTNWSGDITHTGNLTNSGTVKSNNVTLSGHQHNNKSIAPPDVGT